MVFQMRPQNPRPYVTCSASMPCVRYVPAPEYPRLSFFNEFLFHNLCSRSCTIHTSSLPGCCWFAKVSNTCLNYLQPSPLIPGFLSHLSKKVVELSVGWKLSLYQKVYDQSNGWRRCKQYGHKHLKLCNAYLPQHQMI